MQASKNNIFQSTYKSDLQVKLLSQNLSIDLLYNGIPMDAGSKKLNSHSTTKQHHVSALKISICMS